MPEPAPPAAPAPMFAADPSNRSMPQATVIPVLHYPDVPAASAWLCRAFGFVERLRIGGHRVQLAVGEAAIVVAQAPGGALDPQAFAHSVMVRVQDADRHCQAARNAGARILAEPSDQAYGERQYSAEDPAGHVWTFSQSLQDTEPTAWGGSWARSDPARSPEPRVKQSLGLTALVVRDYDEAIAFYVGTLGFTLVEDKYVARDKRWVVVAPPGATESRLLLARASSPQQLARVGDQTGGRVALFLCTDDFRRDYAAYRARGVVFVREPKDEPYGTVAVFRDICGNLWDLLQPKR